MAWNRYPYSDFHEFNLDWVINTLKKLTSDVEDFVSLNAIKYADPIQWDITRQYEKNTVVIDPATGTAYISVAPVPIGVQLTREEYWTVVFDLGSFVVRAAKNFTPNYEAETTTTATISLDAGDLVVWGDTLYVANVNITPGDSYVPDGNITRVTEEDITGRLVDLTTTDKSNLVAAINEVLGALNDAVTMITESIGDLDNLTTTDKTNLVAAINEVLSAVGDAITTLETITGDLDDLNTTDKTNLVAAINEVVTSIGDLDDLTTTDKSNLVAAINEVITSTGDAISNAVDALEAITGDLDDLTTTDKTNLVAAINEVLSAVGDAITTLEAITGDLDDLNTTDKTNLVAAINEVLNTAGKVKNFDTVSDLISADLSEGMMALTAGYYSANDGGGANYSITDVAPSGYYETLSNGLFAELLVNDPVNIRTLGAHGDDTNDDSSVLQYAITNYDHIYLPAGTYLINSACTVAQGKSLIMSGDGKASVLHGENILIIESRAEQLSIIENIKFVNSDTATGGDAILMGTVNGGCGNFTIRNCYFYYCYRAITMGNEVDNLNVTNCYFYRNISSSIYCNDGDTTHAGLYIDGCHFQAAKDGASEIYMTKMINVSITNCIFQAATRTNLKFIRFSQSYNIVAINTYFEILGTGANTNKAMSFSNCNDININIIELSGNIGGGVLWTAVKTAFDFYLCNRITVTGVKYGHNLIDCLMAISNCKTVICDYVSSTIPTTRPDYVRDINEMCNTSGTVLKRTSPACTKSATDVAAGASLSIVLNQEALGFSVDTIYMVTVAATPGNGCGSYLFYGQTLTALATITDVDVTNAGNTLTVTNNTSGALTKLFFTVHALNA